MSESLLKIDHEETSLSFRSLMDFNANNRERNIINLINYLQGVANGSYGNITVESRMGETAATATVTFTDAPSDADTITVNGVDFTVETGSPVTDDEFAPGGTASSAATAFADAVNTSESDGVADVTASADAGVVTLTCDIPGTVGNGFTLSESADNTTVSGANFTGGASDEDVTWSV